MKKTHPNEHIILEADNSRLVLTNKRFWQETVENGKTNYQCIHLQHISSVESIHEHYLIFLILGILITLTSGYALTSTTQPEGPIFGIALGIICLFIYLITRRATVIIASSSTKIKIPFVRMKKERLTEFTQAIEFAIINHQLLAVEETH